MREVTITKVTLMCTGNFNSLGSNCEASSKVPVISPTIHFRAFYGGQMWGALKHFIEILPLSKLKFNTLTWQILPLTWGIASKVFRYIYVWECDHNTAVCIIVKVCGGAFQGTINFGFNFGCLESCSPRRANPLWCGIGWYKKGAACNKWWLHSLQTNV